MTQEEAKIIAEKAANGTATDEEERNLLNFLNHCVEDVRARIKKIAVEKKTVEIKNSL